MKHITLPPNSFFGLKKLLKQQDKFFDYQEYTSKENKIYEIIADNIKYTCTYKLTHNLINKKDETGLFINKVKSFYDKLASRYGSVRTIKCFYTGIYLEDDKKRFNAKRYRCFKGENDLVYEIRETAIWGKIKMKYNKDTEIIMDVCNTVPSEEAIRITVMNKTYIRINSNIYLLDRMENTRQYDKIINSLNNNFKN
jgi:hypothetical protein